MKDHKKLKDAKIGLNENYPDGYVFSNTERAKAVIKKIKPQFTHSRESILFFAVIELAIRDLAEPDPVGKSKNSITRKVNLDANRRSALSYLNGDIPHATKCGVNADWIKDQMRKSGLSLTMDCGHVKSI